MINWQQFKKMLKISTSSKVYQLQKAFKCSKNVGKDVRKIEQIQEKIMKKWKKFEKMFENMFETLDNFFNKFENMSASEGFKKFQKFPKGN